MTRSLVVIAVVGEGALVVVALIWQRLRGIPLAAGDPWEGVLAGTATAVALRARQLVPAVRRTDPPAGDGDPAAVSRQPEAALR